MASLLQPLHRNDKCKGKNDRRKMFSKYHDSCTCQSSVLSRAISSTLLIQDMRNMTM